MLGTDISVCDGEGVNTLMFKKELTFLTGWKIWIYYILGQSEIFS